MNLAAIGTVTGVDARPKPSRLRASRTALSVQISREELNPVFLDFARHYGFAVKTHRIRRPRTKCQQRIHSTTAQRPVDLWVQEKLTALDTMTRYQLCQLISRQGGFDGFVCFEKSRYSLPPEYAGHRSDQGGDFACMEQHTMNPDLPYQIRPRRNFALRVSTQVAGISTVAVPVVVMAEKQIFGQEPIAHRVTLAAITAIAYTANYLIMRMKSPLAFSASFVVTTALTMTLVSALFAAIITLFSGWSTPSHMVLDVRYFLAFVVIANTTFLAFSVHYAFAVGEEVTPLGMIGGIVAALCLPGMFSWLSGASGFLIGVFVQTPVTVIHQSIG